MAKVTIGRWDKNAALRRPIEIMKATGLKIGEEVEVNAQDHQVVITRRSPEAQAEVDAAVKRIIARRRGHSLGGIAIRELIDAGRKY